MGALIAILNSEKGLMAGLLIIGVTILTAIGNVTFTQWEGFSTWIFGIYVGGKSIQGAATAIAQRPQVLPAPAQPPSVSETTVINQPGA